MRTMILLLFFSVGAASCQMQRVTSVPVRQETPHQVKTVTLTAVSQSFQITPMITNTFMRVPATPTATDTPTPTISPTTHPTLTKQESEKLTTEYIKTNGGCKECFWGIVPDVATVDQVETFITKMNRVSEQDQNNISTGFSTKDGLITIEFIFHYNDTSMIDGIRAYLGNFNNPGVSRADWSFYNPDNILREYGIPSRIRIAAGTGPITPSQNKTDYYMSFTFDQSNMVIEYAYAEEAIIDSSGYKICPIKDRITSAAVWYGEYKENPPSYSTNIDQLSNLSNEGFYQKMTSEDGGECIKIKAVQ